MFAGVLLALVLLGCSRDESAPVAVQDVAVQDVAAQNVAPGSAASSATHFTVRGRWPDPHHITYRIEDREGPLDAKQLQSGVQRACATWSATGLVTLVAAEPDTKPDVSLGWRRGHHGACEPFSSDSAVAHSGPVASGTFVHFDAGRKWVADATHDRDGYSLYGTALHELGHVLGLGHSSADDAVMRTGVVRSTPLAASDLFGLQSLYGGGVDGPSDLRIEAAAGGERIGALHGVASPDISAYAVFDADGNGKDDVLVWRTDRAGNGQLMIYHFVEGAQLARTSGPFLGVVAPASSNTLMRTAADDRVLVTVFQNGRRIARRFDANGMLQAFSADLIGTDELARAQRLGNAREGDLDGDGRHERVVLIN